MTPDPLPLLGAEPGGPKILGQLKKSPTSGFRGLKFLPPKIVNGRAHKVLGSHFWLVNGVLPPYPQNQFHLWDVFWDFWNCDLEKNNKITLVRHRDKLNKLLQKIAIHNFEKWGFEIFWVGHFWGLPP